MAKKRGQNMGSVYKRKDGRWVGQVTIEGKPHYKYFKTQPNTPKLATDLPCASVFIRGYYFFSVINFFHVFNFFFLTAGKSKLFKRAL